MSRIFLSRDGNYRDMNGTVIGSKNTGLTLGAKSYLSSKYGRKYANRADANMANGNIYLNGKWRLFDDKTGFSSTANYDDAVRRNYSKTQKIRGRSVFKDPLTGKLTYFNLDAADTARTYDKINSILADNAKTSDNRNSILAEDNSTWHTFISGLNNMEEGLEHTANSAVNVFTNSNGRGLGSNVVGIGGGLGKTVQGALLSTIGTASSAILPESWNKNIGYYGQALDIGKSTNSIVTALNKGELLAPWNESNLGLEDEQFSGLGDKETRRDLLDFGNGVIAILGTKGAGAVGKAVASTKVGKAFTSGIGKVKRSINRSNINTKPVYYNTSPLGFSSRNIGIEYNPPIIATRGAGTYGKAGASTEVVKYNPNQIYPIIGTRGAGASTEVGKAFNHGIGEVKRSINTKPAYYNTSPLGFSSRNIGIEYNPNQIYITPWESVSKNINIAYDPNQLYTITY